MSEQSADKSSNPTRASLLVRIRDIGDGDAWTEFHDLYAPLLYCYAKARGLSHDDAEDVRSECYAALVKQMQQFEYDRSKGSFKSWLRTLVHRRVIDRLRKRREKRADTAQLRDLPMAEESDESVWDDEWRKQHLRFCVRQVKPLVAAQTYEAFLMLVEENSPVATVCETLGMNPNQVYKAKAKMLELVRRKIASLELDSL